MLILLRTCLEIALLRKGPDALPRSRLVLMILLGLYAVPFTIYYLLPAGSERPSAALSLGIVAFGAAAYALVLRIRGFGRRTTQTLSAIFGVAALLNGADVVLSIIAALLAAEPMLISLLRLALLVWSLLIDTHILSAALEWPMLMAAALVLCIFIVQYYVLVASMSGN